MLRNIGKLQALDLFHSSRGFPRTNGELCILSKLRVTLPRRQFSCLVVSNSSTTPAQKWTRKTGIIHSQMTRYTEEIHRSVSTSKATLFLSKKEAIPEEDPVKGKLVYIGTLSNMVKLVKGFSVSSSLVALCLQPFIYANSGDYPLILKMTLGGVMSFFIFLTPLMLHYITKRYVTKLYYNSNTGVFTASTLTFLVNEKDMTFKRSDVGLPEVPGLFVTVKVNGKPLFVDPSLFRDPDGYIKLMGYDKPIDWRMPSKEEKE